MTKISLKAEKRKVSGRKVKILRAQGILPGNVYGRKVKSEAVQVDFKEFKKVYSDAGETGLIELSLGSEVKPVLVHDLQLNPISDEPIHVDFLQVDLKEKVTTKVPVEVDGESPAEKSGVGTVTVTVNELEVEALPADLPEKFTIDGTKLEEVDQVVKVADLAYDKSKVEVKEDPETIIVKVVPPQKEEEIVAPVAPAEGEGVPAEGEGTEGEAKPEGETAEAPQE